MRGFFKTGKGEYGEGDVFLGLTVPQSRTIARQFRELSLAGARRLLSSKYHEERLVALLILVDKFQKGDKRERARVYDFYRANSGRVNNWDLVDLSADKIMGAYPWACPKGVLQKLARSKNLWQRRIAIVAAYNFIKQGRFNETLKIARLLLRDRHDLIHKAVGWMLREVGKRDKGAEVRFLKKYSKQMPRVMLRYAIERFPRREQIQFLR